MSSDASRLPLGVLGPLTAGPGSAPLGDGPLARLCCRLLAAGGRPLSAEQLRADVWEDTPTSPSIVRVTVHRLRAALAGTDSRVVATGGAPVITFVDFNHTKAPTDNPSIRRALSLAIDRAALLALDGPGATTATGWAPPQWKGVQPTSCDACVADAEAARSMPELARSGIDPATVTIELASFEDSRGEAVAQMWRRPGRPAPVRGPSPVSSAPTSGWE